MSVERYQHSGGIGALGIPLMILLGGASAFVLGVIYTFALAWIPIVYVNFLLTAGFGAAIGLIVGACGKAGNVRNPMVIGIFGLLNAVLGLYVAWAFDCRARFEGQVCSGPLFLPPDLMAYIAQFYQQGFWGLGRGNVMVSGIFLGLIWLAEAGVILGLGWLLAHSFVASLPFCELCNRWTDQQEGVARVQPPESDMLALELLCDGQISALRSFQKSPQEAGAFIRIDTAKCPDCQESNFVTVSLIEVTQDKDGDRRIASRALVENMIVTDNDFKLLHEIVPELPVANQPMPNVPYMV